MSHSVPRAYLYLLVFSAGFTTLGVELSASRLLDPWFGNSLIVWAALIGLVLLYLAVGYWLGGLLADRAPRLDLLLRLTALAALAVGLVPTASRPVLRAASQGIAELNAGLLAGTLAGVLLLFTVPVTLLGCISPFAIRLALRDVQSSGQVAGHIYALSTAGSILGSFLPVLWLIPTIGTRRTFAALSIVLLVVVLIGLVHLRRRLDLLLALAGLGLVVGLALRPSGPLKPAAELLYETESAFNYIQVLDYGTERQLRLNEGEGIHSVYRPGGGLADGIWDYFLLAPAFNPAPYRPEQVKRIYVGGLAAGTIPRLFSEAYGPLLIDGAELDPTIIAVGRRWFDMNEPNLRAVAADARWFLAHSYLGDGRAEISSPGYQLIAVDAYRPPYIPFHLVTVEFFRLCLARLAEDGVVAVNVGRTQTDYTLVEAVAATMAQVFPSIYLLDEPSGDSPLGNTLVIATRRPSTLADFYANLPAFDHPMLAEAARRVAGQVRVATPSPDAQVFTDDRAAVEQVVHGIVLRHMLGKAGQR